MDNAETQATLGKRHKKHPINIRVKTRSREGKSVPVSYKTPVMLLIVSSLIKERKHLRKRKMIHSHLRNGYFVTLNQFVMTTSENL